VNSLARLSTAPGFSQTLAYYCLILCLGLNMAVLGPTLPALAAQTHAPLGDMGRLFLAGALGAALGTLLGGRLLDRLPGHVVLGTAGIAAGILMGCIPAARTLGWMLAIAGAKGFAEGILNNGANTLMVWTHREKVSPYMNGLHFSFGLGAFLSPLLVAQVVEIPGAYRWIFVGLGALMAMAGLRAATLPGSPRAAHPSQDEAGTAGPHRIPASIILTAALFLFFYVGAEIAFGGWIYTYTVELALAPAAQAAYITSGFWLAFTIGRLVSVPLATRYTPSQLIAAALLGCVVFMSIVVMFADSAAALWVAALGTGFCMAPVYPSGFTLAVQGLRLTARASGVILLGDSFGAMILPWLVGEVLGAAGPRAMVYLVLGSLAFDLVAFAALLRARLMAGVAIS
jgi:fucose permease